MLFYRHHALGALLADYTLTTAGYTKHFVLCSLCYGSVIGMRAFLRRSPYAEVEPFGSVPSEKINGPDTDCVRAIYTHGGIRTHDPLLRRQLLYPTELRERLWTANIAKSPGFRQMSLLNDIL